MNAKRRNHLMYVYIEAVSVLHHSGKRTHLNKHDMGYAVRIIWVPYLLNSEKSSIATFDKV